LSGLATTTQRTTLSLAQTSRVDADLKVSAVSEAITVTASASSVLETTQLSTNITAQQLDDLPVARTIAGAVSLAPGVSNGVAGFTIGGAASSDNMYLVNGVVVNENLRGQPHNLFIEDAIQETTVMTAGISAEYGRFTGGVISTLTKSGGNEFKGSFRDSLTNPDWTAKTPFATEADHLDAISEVYEATLGGFVLRDRLWFFGAGRLAKTDTQLFTTLTNIPFTRNREETRYEGKLTGQLTPKHSLVASYLDIKDDLINDFQFTILDLGSLINRSLPNSLLALQYNGIFTNSLLIEAAYSKKEFAFVGSGSRFTDRINGTLMIDNPTGRRYWTSTFCGVCTNEGRNNDLATLKGTYYLGTNSLGTHNLVFGAESFAEERIANNHQSGSDFRVLGNIIRDGNNIYPRFDTNTIIQWNPISSESSGTDFKTNSIFVNDRWDLNNRFSFNLGVRYDKNDGKDADGRVVSDDSAFSPRLGLQYDVLGNGRHRFNATYGRYVNKIADGNVGGSAQAAGNPSTFQFRYGGPAVNPTGTAVGNLLTTDKALQILFEWFDSVGGTNNKTNLTFASAAGFSNRIDDPIQSPSVDEITLGYAVQLGSRAYIRTDLISRDWNDFYAVKLLPSTGTATDPFGNVGDVGVSINDNSIKRQYRAGLLSGQARWGRITTGGNYTYATLEGDDASEGAATATSRNTPLASYYPEYLGYAQRRPKGYLAEDVRHRAKAWVGIDIPLAFIGSLNASLLHTYETGSPYSIVGTIDASGRITGNAFAGVATNPGYKLTQLGTQHTYFFSERGALRTADFNSTDLALTYRLPISRTEIFLQGDLLNAFNNDEVTAPNTTVRTRRVNGAASGLAAFNPFTTTPVECPQGAPAATCTSLGAHFQKGPDFGGVQGVGNYQTPRSYRLGVGIRF